MVPPVEDGLCAGCDRGARLCGRGRAPESKPALPLPDKPSIAVLPFENLSGDPEQERLAGGLTEDVITNLSRFRELFVIARNLTEVYKGKPVDVRQVGRELGVRYVLEGSLQTQDDRVRITTQLIDAATGNHVWSERYDRPLDDFFQVQVDVTQQIAATLGGVAGPFVEMGVQAARKKPPANLEAYDSYLLARRIFSLSNKNDNAEARRLIEKAIELDPSYARAYRLLAYTYYADAMNFGGPAAPSWQRFHDLVQKAAALDDADPQIHTALAESYFKQGKGESGRCKLDRALALNPNDAQEVLMQVALTWCTTSGRAEEAVALLKKGMRLDPHYGDIYLQNFGYANYYARYYEDAIVAFRRIQDPGLYSHVHLALSLAQLGRKKEAAAESPRSSRSILNSPPRSS